MLSEGESGWTKRRGEAQLSASPFRRGVPPIDLIALRRKKRLILWVTNAFRDSLGHAWTLKVRQVRNDGVGSTCTDGKKEESKMCLICGCKLPHEDHAKEFLTPPHTQQSCYWLPRFRRAPSSKNIPRSEGPREDRSYSW